MKANENVCIYKSSFQGERGGAFRFLNKPMKSPISQILKFLVREGGFVVYESNITKDYIYMLRS